MSSGSAERPALHSRQREDEPQALHDAGDAERVRDRPTRHDADAKAIERIAKYNESLQRAGVLLALEAIEWGKRAPMGDNEIIEIRQVQEIEEFEPSEAIEREAAE